ncbi:MAG TPA: CDGSH iron-sulfur domain-containing protein [Anaerolineaceae bacterium]|nr:CDGSH iron-sulfur domain-containing protein [Anaerolineaceae bacterium]HPN51382.1 CDGSH iron-sulfur domain-containing protein [Anaerolineaceae bacterium]
MADEKEKKIVVLCDGPYRVEGDVTLTHKTQVVSEYGEPLTWRKDGEVETPGQPYYICRCGHSKKKPFCDDTHVDECFDGEETADTRPTAERQKAYPGGTGIEVRMDGHLCMDSGYCGTRLAHISKLVGETAEPVVRAQVMRMVEHCPSGALTYSLEHGGPDVEPDLPQQAALTTEITSDGPIEGPLWVMGGIPVERADGRPFETRNRVTLCTCGLSGKKPLCDGTHRAEAEKKAHGG